MALFLPSERELDALREVANVGAGHAARALSDLTDGEKVGVDVPRTVKVQAEGLADLLGGPGVRLCAVSVGTVGRVSGKLVLVWPEPDALRLAKRLLQDDRMTLEHSAAESALAEAANIMMSACLSAVGTLGRLQILPSIPALRRATAIEVAKDALAETVLRLDSGRWVLEARVYSQTAAGQLMLLPDAEGLQALLAQLR